MTIDITRLRELLDKSLGRAYSLGQTYWMQADSESYSQNRKADETQTKFDRMRGETNVEFAALLDELERLRFQISEFREDGSAAVRFAPSSAHWSNELRRLFGEDARQGIDALEARLRKAEADLERKDAEVASLKVALDEAAAVIVDRNAEIARLRAQLEYTDRYAMDSIRTASRDLDDWHGDMLHLSNSARAALSPNPGDPTPTGVSE